MVALVLANGFEEIEAITIADILRRGGISLVTLGLDVKTVKGSHGLEINADEVLSEKHLSSDWDMVVLPGGAGVDLLEKSDWVKEWVLKMDQNKKSVAAICAAPLVLDAAGVLNQRRYTCYPSIELEIKSGVHDPLPVVVDGHIITGRSPGTAMDFALKLVEVLVGKDVSEKIKRQLN